MKKYNLSEIFTTAHARTKAAKAANANIDYRAQFAAELKYAYELANSSGIENINSVETNISIQKPEIIHVNMPYRDYKKKYSDRKTLRDYDERTKTITVCFDEDDPVTKSPNFGNRYRFGTIWLKLREKGTDGTGFEQGFKAISCENAIKQAKKRYPECEIISNDNAMHRSQRLRISY